MIKNSFLIVSCLLSIAICSFVFAADSEVTLDTTDSSSGFAVKDSVGTTVFRAGGDGEIKGFGIVPIGSVIAWHKTLSGVPVLPDGWVECNGQTLADSGSLLNGSVIPNLNGEERFLRGSSASGTMQDDAFQGHHHSLDRNIRDTDSPYSTGQMVRSYPSPNSNDIKAADPISDGINGTPRTANETRPINMSVVWVMRVK
jgi:hypothetical protein